MTENKLIALMLILGIILIWYASCAGEVTL